MSLKAIVDKIEEVDEAFRVLYTEKDGKWHLNAIEGLPTPGDVERLNGALRKEREDHGKVKEKLRAFGTLDPAQVQEQLDRIPELEALAAGKNGPEDIDKLVEARVAKVKGPLDRQIAELTATNGELTGKVGEFESANKTRQVADAVRSALSTNKGFQASATDDVLMLAERHFEIDETSGKVITRDNVGVTPGLDPAVWLTEMQTKRPHWWGPTEGGGSRGNNGGGAISDNPWSHANWNMTKQGEILKSSPERAEQLAKSAGTSIGGPKPEPKK